MYISNIYKYVYTYVNMYIHIHMYVHICTFMQIHTLTQSEKTGKARSKEKNERKGNGVDELRREED